MDHQEADRLLSGDESLNDRLDTLSKSSTEIRKLSAEVPREAWDQHLGRELAIPSEFSAQVQSADALTRDQVGAIETAVEAAHGISAPFCAVLEIAGGVAVAYLAHEEKGFFAL